MNINNQNFKALLFLVFLVSKNAVIADSIPEWKIQQLPDKPSLRSSAIKDNVIWVAGTKGKVFKSLDTGLTWIDVSLKDHSEVDIRDIHVFDNNTAILMSVGSGETSRLYKTSDAGESWNVLYQNTDKSGFFDSIDFWDNDSGVLLGDPVDGYYVIKITKDGGKTWRRIDEKNLPKQLEKEAAFAASGNTLIVGKSGKAWFTTGGYSASIIESNDYGNTWNRHSVPLYNKTQTAGGYGIGQNELGKVFVVGGDYEQRDGKYNNAVTTNEKGHWIDLNTGNNGLRTAMTCVNSTCIITGKLSSDISIDNGYTWTPFKTQGFYTLASDSNTIIGAGVDGTVGVINL